MAEQNVLILSGLHERLKPVHRALQILSHLLKKTKRLLHERFINKRSKLLLSGKIILIDLIGLFEQTLLKFQQVPVVPCKYGDLA